ncbi:hypothetical protein [Kingella potus]|uniref:hypothetical protein n=1 Tax=Kingella potus TaxID=265175 RepID=UPI0015597D0C|nr:hypothetical protein [Kingella potus]UOP00273.1 hypothetical protein LVJ84_10190 [Kingella potus]
MNLVIELLLSMVAEFVSAGETYRRLAQDWRRRKLSVASALPVLVWLLLFWLVGMAI